MLLFFFRSANRAKNRKRGNNRSERSQTSENFTRSRKDFNQEEKIGRISIR